MTHSSIELPEICVNVDKFNLSTVKMVEEFINYTLSTASRTKGLFCL